MVGDSQRIKLERFQRDLLRQHDIASGWGSLGRKAPSPCNTPVGSKLFDVHRRSQANPVAPTGVGAHHFEKLAPVVLFGLIGREPLAQKILTSLFAMKMRAL